MTLPILTVEADGELEIPAAQIGLPEGTEFFVQECVIPANGDTLEQKAFLVIQKPMADLTQLPTGFFGDRLFNVAIPASNDVNEQTGVFVLQIPVANRG